MPTLVRLLTTLAVIAGIIYGIMAALVYFVEPTRRPTTIDVPLPPLSGEATPSNGAAPPTAEDGSRAVRPVGGGAP